ncbi:MAG: MFS transporter [Planctomycetota bacterium]|nr:MFS transporter [Planctomycetota bacterium]
MPAFMLRALKYRNYRLFFGGQGISLVGTWLSMVATQWLIFRLAPRGEAARMLGIAGFCSQIPVLLVGPWGGVVADRFDNKRLLLISQTLSMLQSVALAVLAFTDLVTIPQVIALGVFQGFVSAIDMPARQTFLFQIVEDMADLPNAIAINSTMFNAARLVGPAIAGMIIARTGTSYCFAIDAVTFLAVIVALLAMRIPPKPPRASRTTMFFDMKHGARYSWNFSPVRTAILLGATVSLSYMSLMVILPIFADKLSGTVEPSATGEDPGGRVYGFLTAATGCGALLSGLYLAARSSVRGLGRLIGLSPILLGMGCLYLAQSYTLAGSIAAMFVMGLGILLMFASLNTVLQTIVEDDKRGRVLSFFTTSFMGMAPFGSLLGGYLAGHLGERNAARVSGAIAICAGLIFLAYLPKLRAVVRPIYEAKGIRYPAPAPETPA